MSVIEVLLSADGYGQRQAYDEFYGGGTWTCTCGATGGSGPWRPGLDSPTSTRTELVDEFVAHVVTAAS